MFKTMKLLSTIFMANSIYVIIHCYGRSMGGAGNYLYILLCVDHKTLWSFHVFLSFFHGGD